MQGIDGMWGRRGVWLRALVLWSFLVSIGLLTLRKHEMSSNELVSCVWRQVDTENRWKVGYEGVWLRVSAALGFCVSVGLENITET